MTPDSDHNQPSMPEPSLSDIASLIRNMEDKVDCVKADLTKSMNDQAASIEASLKRNIDEVVGPLAKRQEEFEVKSDDRFNKLEQKSDDRLNKLEQKSDDRLNKLEQKSDDRFNKLEQSFASLTELLERREREPLPPQSVSAMVNHHQYPPLPALAHTSQPLPGFTPLPPAGPGPVHGEHVHKLISGARHVVGIGPVYQSHLDQYKDASPSDKVRSAAIEALRLELNIKDEEIKDTDILEAFLPKNSPKFPRVYIRFIKQEHADLCFRAAKGLTDPNVKVFRYFPRQLQARVRPLEDVAYQLRKNSVPNYKTEVVYSEDDVQLMVCPRGQSRYSPYHVLNLPPVDMTPLRSPPPGRPSQKRDRSASSSPKQSKAVRQNSPEPSAAPTPTVTEPVDTAATATGATDSSSPRPIPLINQTTDLGGFSSMEVMSPLTGRVSFNFKEPVNLRRQSLNL